MKRYFTHYWSNPTWKSHQNQQGALLEHTAGNQFQKRGVSPGDSIYVLTVQAGRLFLLGRLVVDRLCSKKDAEKLLGQNELWPAKEHVLASAATPMDFALAVPVKVAKKLRFVTWSECKSVRFVGETRLDQQTLRSVRQLEPESAALLDELLPKDRSVK